MIYDPGEVEDILTVLWHAHFLSTLEIQDYQDSYVATIVMASDGDTELLFHNSALWLFGVMYVTMKSVWREL